MKLSILSKERIGILARYSKNSVYKEYHIPSIVSENNHLSNQYIENYF